MGKVTLSEMKRYRYDSSLSTGCLAASGTLAILIPPSTAFIVYGILVEESIASLFAAGILPGLGVDGEVRPEELVGGGLGVRQFRAALRQLTRPLIALVIFNGVIVLTHWPMLVNAMLEHHSLHLVGHVVLFGSATLMWWPVVSPLPEMPTLSYPGRMLYLFLQSIVPTVPASFLTFGSTPLYSFYEQAPWRLLMAAPMCGF